MNAAATRASQAATAVLRCRALQKAIRSTSGLRPRLGGLWTGARTAETGLGDTPIVALGLGIHRGVSAAPESRAGGAGQPVPATVARPPHCLGRYGLRWLPLCRTLSNCPVGWQAGFSPGRC